MTPSRAINQPVLVYNRIAQNQRRTVLLVAISMIALVPFVVGVSYLVSRAIVSQVSPAGDMRLRLSQDEADGRAVLPGTAEEDLAWFDARYGNRIRREQADLARQEAEDIPLLLQMMLTIGAAVTAVLGLLFWAIAKSPTAKLLSQAGAWPAGSADAEAARLLENLAVGAGLPTPKLYVIETDATNAFAAGMRPEDAVVAVTRGALHLLDRRELEGVLAHELSHIGNRDTRLNAIAASVALCLRLPYLLFKRKLTGPWISVGRYDVHDGVVLSGESAAARAGLSLLDVLALPVAVYILVVAPVLGTLIRAAISREREYLADADAALLTRFPQG
jgi:Zn-dependent protease with chaperone function